MAMPEAPIEIVHFADPWCWWSWGLEPVLQRLREVYGDQVKVTYRMGGEFETLTGWMREYGVDEASAQDWIRESLEAMGNPVRPDYYVRTGVESSYPACRAFKAAELQSAKLAERYFRRMMEAFGLECRPGTDEELLRLAAEVGLDRERLREDMASPETDVAFAYATDARPAPEGRPWVLANMISSLDGAATLASGTSGGLGGAADKQVFAAIRAVADVILVGAGTVAAEDYGQEPLPRGSRDPGGDPLAGRPDVAEEAGVFAPLLRDLGQRSLDVPPVVDRDADLGDALAEARVRRDARRRVVDKVAAAVMLQSWLEGARA